MLTTGDGRSPLSRARDGSRGRCPAVVTGPRRPTVPACGNVGETRAGPMVVWRRDRRSVTVRGNRDPKRRSPAPATPVPPGGRRDPATLPHPAPPGRSAVPAPSPHVAPIGRGAGRRSTEPVPAGPRPERGPRRPPAVFEDRWPHRGRSASRKWGGPPHPRPPPSPRHRRWPGSARRWAPATRTPATAGRPSRSPRPPAGPSAGCGWRSAARTRPAPRSRWRRRAGRRSGIGAPAAPATPPMPGPAPESKIPTVPGGPVAARTIPPRLPTSPAAPAVRAPASQQGRARRAFPASRVGGGHGVGRGAMPSVRSRDRGGSGSPGSPAR